MRYPDKVDGERDWDWDVDIFLSLGMLHGFCYQYAPHYNTHAMKLEPSMHNFDSISLVLTISRPKPEMLGIRFEEFSDASYEMILSATDGIFQNCGLSFDVQNLQCHYCQRE